MTTVDDGPETELEKRSREFNRAWGELLAAVKGTPEGRWLRRVLERTLLSLSFPRK